MWCPRAPRSTPSPPRRAAAPGAARPSRAPSGRSRRAPRRRSRSRRPSPRARAEPCSTTPPPSPPARATPTSPNNAATALATAGPAADLQITLNPDRPSATVGQQLGWSAVVGNAGPQSSTGTVATINLPAGLTGVQATVPGGSCTVSGQVVTCQVPDLAPGASATIQITGTAGRDTADQTLSADAVVAGSRPDPGADEQRLGRRGREHPAGGRPRRREDHRQAHGRPRRDGDRDHDRHEQRAVDGDRRRDQRRGADGVTVESITSSKGTCTVTGTAISCPLGTLADGEVVTITLVVTIEQAGAGSSLLSAASRRATSSTRTAATTRAGERAERPRLPEGRAGAAEIELTKEVDQASPVTGGTVVWTITAKNTGDVQRRACGSRTSSRLGSSTWRRRPPAPLHAQRAHHHLRRELPRTRKAVSVKITTRAAVAGAEIANIATVTAAGGGTAPARAACSQHAPAPA